MCKSLCANRDVTWGSREPLTAGGAVDSTAPRGDNWSHRKNAHQRGPTYCPKEYVPVPWDTDVPGTERPLIWPTNHPCRWHDAGVAILLFQSSFDTRVTPCHVIAVCQSKANKLFGASWRPGRQKCHSSPRIAWTSTSSHDGPRTLSLPGAKWCMGRHKDKQVISLKWILEGRKK